MSDDLMCVCGDRRSVHRLGRAGCKADDCGCDRFEAAEDQPAAGPAPAAPVDADLPPIHTEQQRRVLVRYAAGASPGLIISETDLNREFVTACVGDLAKFDRERALRLVREYDTRTPAVAAAKSAIPKRKASRRPPAEERAERERVATAVLDVTTAHAAQARTELAELNGASFPAPATDGLADLLRRGDASTNEQCRALASSIRDSIDALHARLAEVAEEETRREAALAKVAAARAALDVALAELAAVNGGPADVTTTPPSTEE